MFKTSIDREKNRLTIKLEGFLGAEEAAEAADKVIEEAGTLRPNFDVISDISDFKPGNEQVQAQIMRAQKGVADKGARRVVRVTGNVIGKLQFKRVHQQAHVNYEVIEVNSEEAAHKFLNEN